MWIFLEAIGRAAADRPQRDADREQVLAEALRVWWRQLEAQVGQAIDTKESADAVRGGMDAADSWYDQGPGKVASALAHAADRNGDGVIGEGPAAPAPPATSSSARHRRSTSYGRPSWPHPPACSPMPPETLPASINLGLRPRS
ncbi:hypothetical protein [Nonomuraea sp. GTA35]|uniref:hypothetical protein n=1 Tax=Nonomuraea sp. GTA35 TaxID=1676746 RepID=UPI0035C004C9